MTRLDRKYRTHNDGFVECVTLEDRYTVHLSCGFGDSSGYDGRVYSLDANFDEDREWDGVTELPELGDFRVNHDRDQLTELQAWLGVNP